MTEPPERPLDKTCGDTVRLDGVEAVVLSCGPDENRGGWIYVVEVAP